MTEREKGAAVGLQEVISVVTEALPGPKLQIIAVYLVGSRACNVHTEESDYDLIVVVDYSDDYTYEIPGLKAIEKGELNCNVYHIQYFQSLIQENVLWAVFCLFLPKECVWLAPSEVYQARFTFQLRKIDLRRVALLDADHNWGKARRLWKTDRKVAKKNIVHSLRYPSYALQLLEQEAITDIYSANKYHTQVMSNTSEDWNDYRKLFKPVYDEICGKIKALTQPLAIPSDLTTDSKVLKTIQYIQHFGLNALSKELNIRIVPHPSCPHTYGLFTDGTHSIEEHEIIIECANAMLIYHNPSKNEIMPFCYSYPRIDDLTTISSPDKFDWASLRATPLKTEGDGMPTLGVMRKVSLYYHPILNTWNLFTSASPDGADPIIKITAEEGFYYRFPKKSHYDPWKFFENDVMPTRNAFIKANQAVLSKAEDICSFMTFDKLFWELWKVKEYQLPHPDELKLCYTFDVHVKRLQKLSFSEEGTCLDTILLSSVRDLETMKAMDCDRILAIAEKHGWKCSWSNEDVVFSSREDALQKVAGVDLLDCVGYQVCDPTQRRWELLSPQYIALKELCWCPEDNETRRGQLMLQIVKTNHRCDSFLKCFPHWEDWYSQVRQEYVEFCERVMEVYDAVKGMDKADFARKVKAMKEAPILFLLYNRKVEDIYSFLSQDCPVTQLQKWMMESK